MSIDIDVARFEELKASGDLPSPRGVALAIMRMAQRDDVSLPELATVIKSDPAFVGRLVKAANGMVLPGRRAVVSVQDALLVLGLPAVKNMALGFSLLNDYRRGLCRGFDYEGFWSNALLMAICMQLLAQRTRVAAADEMFSLGLLARVGELALATVFPESYSEILRDPLRNDGGARLHAEQETFALDHCALGAAMLADWGIPPIFCRAVHVFELIERTEMLDEGRERTLAGSLCFARWMACRVLSAVSDVPVYNARVAESARMLALSDDVVQKLFERIVGEWRGWAAMLQLRAAGVADTTTLPTVLATPLQRQADDRAEGGTPFRVLVVEDDRAVRALISTVIREAGYEVLEACNGREGLDAAINVEPDIILVDWVMPEMDGAEMVRSLRATRHGRGIYIVLLTVVGDERHLVEAFEVGVDDFISKPFNPRVLTARLQAGRRLVNLQRELAREREELRHYAAELAVSNRRLNEAALTDTLTGFRNRRYAMERLQQEWSAVERSGHPLSCLVVDLDGFKQINDAHGHDVGDQVLRSGAQALESALRRQDVICRIGGDEFLVICPDTPFDAAMICAERLRGAMDALRVDTGDVLVTMTASIGVAARESGMANMDALIKLADRGAYLAKSRGRNQVCSWALERTGGD